MSGGGGSLAVPVGDGLGDDADIGNAGLAESVDDGAEGTEGNGFVGAKVDHLVLALGLFPNFVSELMNVDGLVAEIDELILVHGDDKALLGDFLDGVGLGDVDFDAGLEDGRGDHEDDEEDEDDVDERHHVDVGEARLSGFGDGGHGWRLRGCDEGCGHQISVTRYQEAKRKLLSNCICQPVTGSCYLISDY